jgi:predicted metal-dependent enzyme (double-stranded beta helix superfamily)
MGITNLEQLCRQFQVLLEEKPEVSRLIHVGGAMLSELMSHRDWFGGILEKILFDREFSEGQKAGIWANEITLYRSPDRSFQVLCYIWGPYLSDTAHDHGSWGIIGSFVKPIGERKYKRLDDGKKEGYAELKEFSSRVLEPGETTSVLPLNNGIHRMENRSDDVAITINVYGRTIRKGYIQFFYPEDRAVARVYPAKSLKEALAVRAVGALRAPWSEDLLKRVLSSGLPDPIRKEGEYSLARLKSAL